VLFKIAIALRRKRLGQASSGNGAPLYSDDRSRSDKDAFQSFHIVHELSLIANYHFARYMCIGGSTLPKIGRCSAPVSYHRIF
jgi:hypothetical protein